MSGFYALSAGAEAVWQHLDPTKFSPNSLFLKEKKLVCNGMGYTPIRVMFYYPNRVQAIRIQGALATLYAGVGGQYYYGDAAWAYVRGKTGIDLKGILEEVANERTAAEL